MSRKYFFSIVNIAIVLGTLTLLATPALAVHPDERGEIENLKARIEALENGQKDDAGSFAEKITLSGVIEAEAAYVDPEVGDAESDLSLATAELNIEATLSENVGGHVILLYEEGEGLDVDEAVISLTSPGQVANQTPALHVGQMYLPFGMYNSYMISDPLTLEIGETLDTALIFALEGDFWSFSLGTFNGEVDVVGDKNHIDNLVAAFEMTPIERLSFGLSYISDLAESDSGLVQDATLYTDDVAGVSGSISAHCGRFGFEAEYLSALDDFDSALIGLPDTGLTGSKPEAWNVELAWMPSEQLQLAARYEESTDFMGDQKRYGATASYGLYDNVVVALEYLRAEADAVADSDVDTVTAQLALEF